MPPRSARLRRNTSRCGFTLAELVATLLVVSLLSGMALPSLRGLAGARESVAATRVRTVLAFAHEWASASGSATWVAFDAGADSVSVFVEDPAHPGAAQRLPMPDPLTRSALVLQLGDGGVGIESADFGGGVEVQFDATGSPRDAAGVALAVDGLVGLTGGGTVRVTKSTGLVTLDP